MPAQSPRNKSRLIRIFKLILKFTITVLCFWYISTRISFREAFEALLSSDFLYLIPAFLFFVLSKFFSAIRLKIFFDHTGLNISHRNNIRLYLLGMFYNLFLPGAISGDAYKVILLKKHYGTPVKKGTSAVLVDRVSGVLALLILLCIYGIILLEHPYYDTILFAGTCLSLAGYYFVIRFLFRQFLPGFFPTLLWGLAVQLSQVICIYLVMISLGISLQQHEWIFIFLASAVISILPVSLGGGLGTRELVFAEGARYFHLDPQTGVVISLLFYLITVAGSVWGVYYVFNNPIETEEPFVASGQAPQQKNR